MQYNSKQRIDRNLVKNYVLIPFVANSICLNLRAFPLPLTWSSSILPSLSLPLIPMSSPGLYVANSSDVTLAFEDARVIPPFSWKETDDTDYMYGRDDAYDIDDTDNADDTDKTKIIQMIQMIQVIQNMLG